MSRKRSAQVSAGFVIFVAAQLAAQGCESNVMQVRRCVDYYGNILPDYYCTFPYGYYPSGYNSIYYAGHPNYVFGGSVVGGRVTSYSTAPLNGANVFNANGLYIGKNSGGSFSANGQFNPVKRNGFGGSGGGGSFGG